MRRRSLRTAGAIGLAGRWIIAIARTGHALASIGRRKNCWDRGRGPPMNGVLSLSRSRGRPSGNQSTKPDSNRCLRDPILFPSLQQQATKPTLDARRPTWETVKMQVPSRIGPSHGSITKIHGPHGINPPHAAVCRSSRRRCCEDCRSRRPGDDLPRRRSCDQAPKWAASDRTSSTASAPKSPRGTYETPTSSTRPSTGCWTRSRNSHLNSTRPR